jgi:HpcH/HpaI aldolase/citrate lyase family
MAVHRFHRSILSLKSWLFTPTTKTDRFGRAAEVHADALIIDLEDAVALSDKQKARTAGLQYLQQQAEGRFDRTGAPRVPGRAHGSGQGDAPAVSLKNLKTGETIMKDRCIHPNASTSHSAFHSKAVGASVTREVWSDRSRKRSKETVVLVAALVLFAGNAWTQENNAVQSQSVATSSGAGEANDTNAANNPAHPLLTVDLWNYFAPSPEGFPGRIGNQGLLRLAVPIDAFGLHQFLRTILPINTTASVQGGPNTGVGDLTIYDWVLFQEHGTTVGVGPLIAAPTARGEAYGSGKWQAGAAGLVVAPRNWGILALVATYQHSFSGNSSSPVGQLASVQPFVIRNLHRGFYLRSSSSTHFPCWDKHPGASPCSPAGSCLHPAKLTSTVPSCSSYS